VVLDERKQHFAAWIAAEHTHVAHTALRESTRRRHRIEHVVEASDAAG